MYLELVAGAGCDYEDEEINEVGKIKLGLADPDALHKDHIEPRI